MCAVPNIIIIIIIITIILNNTNCRFCGSESYDIKNSSPLGYGNIWIGVSVIRFKGACHLHLLDSRISLEYTELEVKVKFTLEQTQKAVGGGGGVEV
jgi:hypothetical protein